MVLDHFQFWLKIFSQIHLDISELFWELTFLFCISFGLDEPNTASNLHTKALEWGLCHSIFTWRALDLLVV